VFESGRAKKGPDERPLFSPGFCPEVPLIVRELAGKGNKKVVRFAASPVETIAAEKCGLILPCSARLRRRA
jgi:hypothetical protein